MLPTLLFLSACGSGGQVLAVDVVTDFAPGAEFSAARASLSRDPTIAPRVITNSVFTATDGRFRAAEFDNLDPADYTLNIQLLDATESVVVESTARVAFVENGVYTAILSRSCRGVVCPSAGDPSAADTCWAGRCVTADCRAMGDCASECTSGAACPTGAPCSIARCTEGVCLLGGDDTMCAADERCEPEVGCVCSDCECAEDTTRDLPCARCGTQVQRCIGGAWVDEGTCGSMGECDADATDSGALCGVCGQERRTCDTTCTWSPFDCAEEDVCRHFVLDRAATSWRGIRPDGEPFAPASPVLAAFDVEALDRAYVFTDSTYHVMQPSNGAYIEAGDRDFLIPQLVGEDMIAASSIPATHAGGDGTLEGVLLSTVGDTFIYDYRIATEAFEHSSTEACCGAAWSVPDAPARSAVIATVLDVTNEAGWASLGSIPACPVIGPWLGYLTTTNMHLFESGGCFEFYASPSYDAFAPFAVPGAPSSSDIGAVFWHQGALHVLRQ